MNRTISAVVLALVASLATPAGTAEADTPLTHTRCSGNGGYTWFQVWSGRVATKGTHKGKWPLYGWQSGTVKDEANHVIYDPRSPDGTRPATMSLGGQAKPVAGVQVVWIPKGYATRSMAAWSRYDYVSKTTTTTFCLTRSIKALGS